MKKTKLIAGILLMILGIGVSIGSVVLHRFERCQYGMMNARYGIVNGRGMMGGYGFRGPSQRGFNVNPNQKRNPNTNPQPNQSPSPSPSPNQSQNQNQGQSGNGGVNR